MTTYDPELIQAVKELPRIAALGSSRASLSVTQAEAILSALPEDLVAAATAPPLPTEPGSKAVIWCGSNDVRYRAMLVRVVVDWATSHDAWVDLASGRSLATPNRWEPMGEESN